MNLNNRTEITKEKNNRHSLNLIFFIMLMDVIGITILSPVAPQIVLRYSDSALMVTMVTMIYALGQFTASPIIGKIGDRVGRRPVLLISLIGQALGYLIFGIGGSLWVLFLGRLIGGITAGNLSTATAYIADISKPEERSKNFAMINLAWSIGLILGPSLGGIFGEFNLETPAFIAAFVTLINVVIGYFVLKESLPESHRVSEPMKTRDFNPVLSIFDMVKIPGLGIILLSLALFSFAFNGVNSVSALFIIQKFNAVTWQVSLFMILSGVSIAISNGVLVPKLVPRFGERITGIASLALLGLFYILMFFVPVFWVMYPMNMLAGGLNSFIFPAMTTLSTERVNPTEIGKLMGVSSAVQSAMNVLGPLFAGFVYDGLFLGAPYITSAIVLMIGASIMLKVKQNKPV